MLRNLFKSRQHRHEIFVPASVLAQDAKEYALVGSVVSWVNAVRDRGAYSADEIVEEAQEAYNADYYYAQVCNGGHSQFRHNSQMDPMTLAFAQSGLKNAGLTELAACLGALIEAPEMESAALEALDSRFFAAYSDYHKRINAWLQPCVRVVPDGDYPAKLEQFLKLDGARGQRFRDREAVGLQAKIENAQLAGYAQVAYEVTGGLFLGVRPGSFASVFGQQTVIWGIPVRTEQGEETVFNGMDVAERFLLVPKMPKETVETEEQLLALFNSGRNLKKEVVVQYCELARKERLGLIAALLLDMAPDLSSQDVVALHLMIDNDPERKGRYVAIHCASHNRPFVLRIDDSKTMIISLADKAAIAVLSNREVRKALRQFDARNRVH